MTRTTQKRLTIVTVTVMLLLTIALRAHPAEVLANRVAETTTTTGTGTLLLAGAKTGYQTFAAGIGTGNTCAYLITDGTNWEIGTGTVTDAATDTLSRDAVEASSSAGAKVNWTAGSKDVHNILTAGTIGSFTATTREEIEDYLGQMVSGNTETRITVTYDDTTGKINFVVDDLDTDTDTHLTEEQVEDFAGSLLNGTETRITVTYDDAGNAVNFVVDDMNDDQPDSDAEVPDAITVNPVNAATEAAIEAVVDLPDLQGAVTDAQVPDDITITNLSGTNTGDQTAGTGLDLTGGTISLSHFGFEDLTDPGYAAMPYINGGTFAWAASSFFVLSSEFTADGQIAVGTGNGTYQMESGATARISLELGDSATKNVGTGPGDVSAGNHTHTAVVTANAATCDVVSTAEVVIVNCTYTDTGAITSLTLDTDICVSGKIIHIKDADFNAGTNNITVDTEGAETIDEAGTVVIDANGDSIRLYSDGSNWFIF